MTDSPFSDSANASRNEVDKRYLLWAVPMLTTLAFLPFLLSGFYLAKTLWAVLAVGGGLMVRPPKGGYRIAITPLGLCWTAYLLWALLSVVWAPQHKLAMERWLALLLPTVAYFLARRSRFWESGKFWNFFCVLILFMSLVGLLQYRDLLFANKLGGETIPRAFFGISNIMAMFFALSIPFLGWRYYKTQGIEGILSFAALLVASFILALTRTRSAWIGTICAVVAVMIAGLPSRMVASPRKSRNLLLVGVVVFVASFFLKPDEQYIRNTFRLEKGDVFKAWSNITKGDSRLSMWKLAMKVDVNPVLGAGLGNFPILLTPVNQEKSVTLLNWHVHNEYLQAFLDLGVPGVLFFVLTLFLALRYAWVGRRDGLILASGASVVVLCVMQMATFTMERVSCQIWIAGVFAVLMSRSGVTPLLTKNLKPSLGILLNYMVAFVLLFWALCVGDSAWGQWRMQKTQSFAQLTVKYIQAERKPGNMDRAKLEKIRELLPGMVGQARREVKTIIKEVLPRIPFDCTGEHALCNQFAALSLHLGDLESAQIFTDKTLELHPNDRLAHVYRIDIAVKQNRIKDALKYLDEAVRIFGYDPNSPLTRHMAGLLSHTGRESEMQRVIREAEINKVKRPSLLRPARKDMGVALRPLFDWDETSMATQQYHMYLWKRGEQVPVYPVVTSPRETTEARLQESLESNTLYFWRVDSVGFFVTAQSEVGVFTTGPETLAR